jgi:NADPH2:quinone reductase
VKAIVCDEYGLAHASMQDMAPPDLPADGVRLDVKSVGVSFANLLAIEGKHQNRQQPPFTPGTEVAGVVIETGPAARRFKPGDRVVAGLKTGGYAQQAVAPETNVYALPHEVDFDAAVQFPTIYATAYGALKWRAHLQPGEWLLVHGAAGGSGLAAIEIGKVLGARVIATAGSAEKVQAALAHGADIALNYREQDFREAVLSHTGDRGADVIFDPVGGATFEQSLRCIAPDGRIIPMGFAGGAIPQIPANIVLVKNISVIGLYWGYYMGWARQPAPAAMAEKVRAAFAEMLGWTAEGKLRPHTWRGYPLAEFRQALEAISSRQVIGRVVLHP